MGKINEDAIEITVIELSKMMPIFVTTIFLPG